MDAGIWSNGNVNRGSTDYRGRDNAGASNRMPALERRLESDLADTPRNGGLNPAKPA